MKPTVEQAIDFKIGLDVDGNEDDEIDLVDPFYFEIHSCCDCHLWTARY